MLFNMFWALLCPSSGALSSCSRSLRFPYECRGRCVSSRGRFVTSGWVFLFEYRSTCTWDSRFSRLWQRVIFCFFQLVMKMVAVPSIEYTARCHNPEYQNINVNLLPFSKICYVNIIVQLGVVHWFWKHDSRSRNQLHILSTVQSLRSNILMFRTGMIVFLFLLLVVVNRPVLYTVQVLGGYEAMSVEFCIHLLWGCYK
jgi:hypothetical protein